MELLPPLIINLRQSQYYHRSTLYGLLFLSFLFKFIKNGMKGYVTLLFVVQASSSEEIERSLK
jgi:hypothetical protein